MRKVYITFSNDSQQIIYGPFWCMEDANGDPQTSLIEDMIDDLQGSDHSMGDPTIWFDNPPKVGVNPPNDDPASRWEGF